MSSCMARANDTYATCHFGSIQISASNDADIWHVARARATWHQPLRNWHHLLSAFPAHLMVPRRSLSAQPFVLQLPKCLNGQTDGQTDRQTLLSQLFSSDPPEEIFEHKGSNAKALEPLYSTILNWRPAMLYAMPWGQNRRS